MKNKEVAIGVACQIAFEYEDWGEEHVSDMLRTYDIPARPCSYDELMDLTVKADRLKSQGKSYDEVEKELANV